MTTKNIKEKKKTSKTSNTSEGGHTQKTAKKEVTNHLIPGAIIVKDGTLDADYTTTDPETVAYFEKIKSPLRYERFDTLVKLGIQIMNGAQTSQQVALLDANFANWCNQLNSGFNEYLKQTGDQHDATFGENGKLEEKFQEYFATDGKLMNEFMKPYHENIKKDFQELLLQLGIKTKQDEIINQSTLKGKPFEDLVIPKLATIAKICGDTLLDTTNISGKLPSCKVGDVVITYAGTNLKATFDLKNVQKITLKDIEELRKKGLDNREAQIVVVVAKTVESLPESIGDFQPIGDDLLVCALGSSSNESMQESILLIAYKWARAQVLLKQKTNNKIHPQFFQSKISSIQQKMTKLKTIKGDCSSIDKSSKRIRDSVDVLTKEVNDDLDEMNKALGP